MLSLNLSTLKIRKPVEAPVPVYTMVLLNNQPGTFVICKGGVSPAGDVWFAARPTTKIGSKYVASNRSYQFWESDIANLFTVPTTEVL